MWCINPIFISRMNGCNIELVSLSTFVLVCTLRKLSYRRQKSLLRVLFDYDQSRRQKVKQELPNPVPPNGTVSSQRVRAIDNNIILFSIVSDEFFEKTS
jgi:hypothetical protein